MGPIAREHCREVGVNWLDLSGNGDITAPGVRILVEGQPNLYKQPGRPSSAFAPKSSRIARWLLLHPEQSVSQREIARATDMDEGFTSRIVSRLEEDELVARDPDGAIRVRDPDLLLDAWRQDYDFSKHQVLRGHVAARSGEALVRQVSGQLHDLEVQHAATGLAAAWLLTRFAGFRTVAIYVTEVPSSGALGRLGFREDVPGANLWLVVPNDEGVFHGAGDRDGVSCVHPVQVYLDLEGQPERSEEAAQHLRAELFYVLRNFGTGVRDVASLFTAIRDDSDAEKAVAVLRRDFIAHDGLGPRRVAEFLTGGPDEVIQADVAGYVAALLRALKREFP